MVRTRRGATTGVEDAPLAQSLTLGSLPDDALASILGGLSAQEAARAEATSKAFRRVRPRVVAAQSGHVLRDARVRLTVVTNGQVYSTRRIRPFHRSLCFQQSDAPRLTCVGPASDFLIKMNVYSPGRHSRRYLKDGQDGPHGNCGFISDWEQAARFERVDTIRTADGQIYSTLPGASYIRFRGPGPPRYLVIQRGPNRIFEWPLRHAPESDLTVHRHDRPGECHAFFFLDRLADSVPDYPVVRWLCCRELKRRFPAWDDEIILAAANCTKDNLELAAASFLAMGSPEAWRAWQETWPERWAMPGSVQGMPPVVRGSPPVEITRILDSQTKYM